MTRSVRAAVVVLAAVLCAGAASAGYVREWSSPVNRVWALSEPEIGSTGDCLDMNSDGIPELVVWACDTVEGDPDSMFVYETAGYSLLFSSYTDLETFHGFYDIDADGVKEAVFGDGDGIFFISLDPLEAEWLVAGAYVRSILDIDGDGHDEVIAVVPDTLGGADRMEIWGAGTVAGTPSDGPVNESTLRGLKGNSPNPFSPSTSIAYELAQGGAVEIEIFNVAGRHVRTLEAAHTEAGVYNVVWNGADDLGRQMSSGVYFYTLKCGPDLREGKMVLVK